MSLTHCDTHHEPWKTVPAGVSKSTGRAYGAFQACPVQGCKERPQKANAPRPPQDAPGSTFRPSSPTTLAGHAIQAAATFYAGRAMDEATVLGFAARIFHEFMLPCSQGNPPKPLNQEPDNDFPPF